MNKKHDKSPVSIINLKLNVITMRPLKKSRWMGQLASCTSRNEKCSYICMYAYYGMQENKFPLLLIKTALCCTTICLSIFSTHCQPESFESIFYIVSVLLNLEYSRMISP